MFYKPGIPELCAFEGTTSDLLIAILIISLIVGAAMSQIKR